ncbi:MAG: hypothetical protein ABIQ43_04835 [Sphingomonas sp.]
MTFRSLTIEKHHSQAEATKAYSFEHKPNFLGSLNAYAWPASAVGFANACDLPIDYVDNCWVRVAVNGASLREFLQLGRAVDPAASEMPNNLNDDDWYVIQEEEF